MASASEIRRYVQEYLDGKLSLEAFEDWSASYSWNIHNFADIETRDLAYTVRGALVEHSIGDLNDQAFRKELGNTIRPFARHTQKPILVVYDERPKENRVVALAVAAAAAIVLCIQPSDVTSSRASSAVTPPAIPASVDGSPLVKIASTIEQVMQVPLEYAES